MTEPDNKKSLEKSVMDAIHSGRVRMRPRWKFALSGVLAALGAIILFLTLLYIASFAFFMLRQTGIFFMPEFGWRGLLVFFAAIPLILSLLLIAFVVVLEILVRRYRVGYRTPLLVSVLAIFAIVVIGGYAIERTHIHSQILIAARASEGLPSPIAVIYRAEAAHVHDVYRGQILSMAPGGLVLLDENGAGTTTVLFDPSTDMPHQTSFAPGQEVVVFGDGASGTVHAIGIRAVEE